MNGMFIFSLIHQFLSILRPISFPQLSLEAIDVFYPSAKNLCLRPRIYAFAIRLRRLFACRPLRFFVLCYAVPCYLFVVQWQQPCSTSLVCPFFITLRRVYLHVALAQ